MATAIYVVGVVIVVLVMLSSCFLGQRGKGHGRSIPYESGVKAFHAIPSRFFVHYFLIAIAFVVFDLESAFLFVWATAVREVGWLGFFQVSFFIAMLMLSLLYALRMDIFSVFTKTSDQKEGVPL